MEKKLVLFSYLYAIFVWPVCEITFKFEFITFILLQFHLKFKHFNHLNGILLRSYPTKCQIHFLASVRNCKQKLLHFYCTHQSLISTS